MDALIYREPLRLLLRNSKRLRAVVFKENRQYRKLTDGDVYFYLGINIDDSHFLVGFFFSRLKGRGTFAENFNLNCYFSKR